MRLLLTWLILTVGAPNALAQSPRIDKVEITEAGIFTSETTRQYRAPGTATGERFYVKNIKLKTRTTQIPIRSGLTFGFRYKVFGRPSGKAITLRGVTLFPAEGLRNPDTGNVIRREEYELNATVGEVSYNGYTFDHPWEEVPGTWTFQVWHGERKLAEQQFTVSKP